MKEILAIELKEKMDNNEDFILLDVREDRELVICSIEGALHIPMMNIPKMLLQLDKSKKIIVMCHTGVRSLHACQYLTENGIDAVSLKGGIDEWSKKIDEKVQRY